MRFFTRQLFDAIQPGAGEPENDAANAMWEQNVESYRAGLAKLKPNLRSGFTWLADTTLHDGVILNVDNETPGRVLLEIDAANNPWGQTGLVTLDFRGVTSAFGIADCVGDVWLYEELHASGNACQLCVLLESGELNITAEELDVSITP